MSDSHDTSCYTRTTVPAVPRPVAYRQGYGARKRPAGSDQQSTRGERPGRILTPAVDGTRFHGFRITDRRVSECGLWWLITWTDTAGVSREERRLKGCSEGHG